MRELEKISLKNARRLGELLEEIGEENILASIREDRERG